jgi:hypothetical protein
VSSRCCIASEIEQLPDLESAFNILSRTSPYIYVFEMKHRLLMHVCLQLSVAHYAVLLPYSSAQCESRDDPNRYEAWASNVGAAPRTVLVQTGP